MNHTIHGTPWKYAKDGVVVTIENGITTIGDNVFNGGTRIGQIIIPTSVTTIGNYVFSGCTKFTRQTRSDVGTNILTIPDTVTTIGTYMCSSCSGLTSYEVPKVMMDDKTIHEGTYAYCSNIETMTIPTGIEKIGESAFRECTRLKNMVVPNTVVTIDSRAFFSCTSLEELNLPNSVVTILTEAFYNCTSLEELDLPISVQTIGYYSFQRCTGLTEVKVPCDASFSYYAFEGCSNIDKVTIKEGNTNIIKNISTSTSGSGMNHTIHGTPWKYAKDGVVVTIENGITTIGNYVFCYGSKIGQMIIPISVATIGNSVFNGCSNLTAINYRGSSTDWGNISIGTNNDILSSVTINYNYSD